MFANKHILLMMICGYIGTGCAPSAMPTIPLVQPRPTVTSIQQEPTFAVVIGIPEISNPLIQAENESIDEFVARLAAEDISYSRPVLIALSRLKVQSTVLFGVPSSRQDLQQCWFYETNSRRACTGEDLEKYFSDRTIPKIFFALVYSNAGDSLFLVEHFYNGDEHYFVDHYRLVLELKHGKWVEKSILPVFW